jgi:hypothetical protein
LTLDRAFLYDRVVIQKKHLALFPVVDPPSLAGLRFHFSTFSPNRKAFDTDAGPIRFPSRIEQGTDVLRFPSLDWLREGNEVPVWVVIPVKAEFNTVMLQFHPVIQACLHFVPGGERDHIQSTLPPR